MKIIPDFMQQKENLGCRRGDGIWPQLLWLEAETTDPSKRKYLVIGSLFGRQPVFMPHRFVVYLLFSLLASSFSMGMTSGADKDQTLFDGKTLSGWKTTAFDQKDGTSDEMVPYAQSRELQKQLRAAGVEATLVTVDGGEHESMRPASVQRFIAAFFARHLRNKSGELKDAKIKVK